MRLYYLSQRDMRKNRADCVHIMKSCLAFKENGYLIEIVTPRVYRKEYKIDKNDIWKLYNLEKDLYIIKEFPSIIWDDMGTKFVVSVIFQQSQLVFFSFIYFFTLSVLNRLQNNDVIYSKSYAMSLGIILLKKLHLISNKLFFEKAEFNENKSIHRFVCRNTDGIIAINNYIREKTVGIYEIDPKKVSTLKFTSQYDDFINFSKDKSETRSALNINLQDKIVMYAGKITPNMKEIHYILESARLLKDIKFYFIGIKDEFRKYFIDYTSANGINNAVFIPFLPLPEFFRYLICADILVSYYDSFDTVSVNQRVPAKSSLYLLAERPIIMSDLPGLREWWNDNEIFFVNPDNPEKLSEKILYIFDNPNDVIIKITGCIDFAKKHTYFTSYSEVCKNIAGFAGEL